MPPRTQEEKKKTGNPKERFSLGPYHPHHPVPGSGHVGSWAGLTQSQGSCARLSWKEAGNLG